ncbi:MAG TPA: hypothetical protein VFA71_01635 [Terriglobales bacterium]|nr:hypothetical protein [Terriglobales bacterium]
MNRRHLIKAMLSVPVAGALGGCRHEHSDHPFFPHSRGGILQLILQGPFAVVIDTKNHYRIKAFVPYSGTNDHVFYAPPADQDDDKPFSEQGQKGRNQYQFTLEEHNLETNDRMPHIDAGFADFTLNVSGWQPSPNDYFVTLDLPTPDLISYRVPAEPALLAGDRLTLMPTSHVLQYRLSDFGDLKKVKVRSPQLGERHPLSCADVFPWLEKQATAARQERGNASRQEQGAGAEKDHQERIEHMKAGLECPNNPVGALFFGVGLPYSEAGNVPHLSAHGLDFFNNKLLAAFPTALNLENHRLLQVDVKACGAGNGGDSMFVSAVQRYSMPRPRLVPVTSLTDCRAGAVTAINS